MSLKLGDSYVKTEALPTKTVSHKPNSNTRNNQFNLILNIFHSQKQEWEEKGKGGVSS